MNKQKKRYLAEDIGNFCFPNHKIAFISGPRQCGKTTLAKMLLGLRGHGVYHNWDQVEFRRQWAKQPSATLPSGVSDRVPIIIFDEIHKEKQWKRNLKGVYDTRTEPCDIIVTGSARLGVYMKGSDSLLGRYFDFRLHPFSLREMEHSVPATPETAIENLFSHRPGYEKHKRDTLESFLKFGPFPEPLLGQNEKMARIWRRNREQLIIREDLRDLSNIPDLSKIEMLTALIPDRIGSQLSLAAIREDMECRFDTLNRWFGWLKELYYLFEIKPYSKNIPRSLKRNGKIYLWDYGAIPDKGAKFENLVACHLLKACHYWTDTGEGDFKLWYIRNKDKLEIDFLITRDNMPWLPVEVKLSATRPSANWQKFLKFLPCKRGLQLVNQPIWKLHSENNLEILVADAAEALPLFV